MCHLGELRSIYLLAYLYKPVEKVLANILMLVMDHLISPNQSAFLKGRLLADVVMVVNEMIYLTKKSKKCCFIFKVDFEKAYYPTSWSFQDYMFNEFGFNEKWTVLMRTCKFSGKLGSS